MSIIDDLPNLPNAPTTGDEIPLERGVVAYKVDYNALANAIISKLGGDPITAAHGGSGLSASPQILVNLASTSAVNVMQASPRPGVTGTLPISKGGTGATTASGAITQLGITPEAIGAMSLSDVVLASGSKSFGTLSTGSANSEEITFGSTLSTSNYIVVLQPVTGNITAGAQQKTTTGFTMYVRNVSNADATATVAWAIIKLP